MQFFYSLETQNIACWNIKLGSLSPHELFIDPCTDQQAYYYYYVPSIYRGCGETGLFVKQLALLWVQLVSCICMVSEDTHTLPPFISWIIYRPVYRPTIMSTEAVVDGDWPICKAISIAMSTACVLYLYGEWRHTHTATFHLMNYL